MQVVLYNGRKSVVVTNLSTSDMTKHSAGRYQF